MYPAENDVSSLSATADAIMVYQKQLAQLELYKGKITGNTADSLVALLKFQGDNNLKIDGQVGPATRATLIRAVGRKAIPNVAVTSTVATTAAATGAHGMNTPLPVDAATWLDLVANVAPWSVGATVLVIVAMVAYRYRGVITQKRVPT